MFNGTTCSLAARNHARACEVQSHRTRSLTYSNVVASRETRGTDWTHAPASGDVPRGAASMPVDLKRSHRHASASAAFHHPLTRFARRVRRPTSVQAVKRERPPEGRPSRSAYARQDGIRRPSSPRHAASGRAGTPDASSPARPSSARAARCPSARRSCAASWRGRVPDPDR